jgi:hypothetical protein
MMHNFPHRAVALATMLCAGSAWAGPQTCEVILCQGGCYEGKYKDEQLEDVECDKSAPAPGYTLRVFAATMAPDPVVIECEPMGGGDYLCEGYPNGAGFSYGWSTSGPISLPYPGTPADNAQWVSCNDQGSAVLSMTVISPSGTMGSRNKYFSCSPY